MTTTITTYSVKLTAAQREAFELADAFDYACWYRDNAEMAADDPELEAMDLTIEQWREQVAMAAASSYDETTGVLTLVRGSWLETDVNDYLRDSSENMTGIANGVGHCRACRSILAAMAVAN